MKKNKGLTKAREGVLATLNHLQRLSDAGVEWRSYQERYFDSCGPFKDAVISIMATRKDPREASLLRWN
jgi:hypothetical protein